MSAVEKESNEVVEVFEYPYEIENYFSENPVKIHTVPSEFKTISESEYPAFTISSAQQYVDYLSGEIEFWTKNDPKMNWGFIRTSPVLTVRCRNLTMQ